MPSLLCPICNKWPLIKCLSNPELHPPCCAQLKGHLFLKLVLVPLLLNFRWALSVERYAFWKNTTEISTLPRTRLGLGQRTCLTSLNVDNTGVSGTTLQGLGVSGQRLWPRVQISVLTQLQMDWLQTRNWHAMSLSFLNGRKCSHFSARRSSIYFMAEWQVSGSHCRADSHAWAPAPPPPILRVSGPPLSRLPPYPMLPSVTVLLAPSIWWHIYNPSVDCLAFCKHSDEYIH